MKVLKWLRAAMLRRLEYWIELIAPGWWLDKEGLYVKVLKWLRAAIAATVDRMAWKMLRRLESWPFVLLIVPGWWLDDVAVELFWNLLDPSYDLVLFTTVMPQGDILLGGAVLSLDGPLDPVLALYVLLGVLLPFMFPVYVVAVLAFIVTCWISVGVVYMQNTASGVDISRARGLLVRVSIWMTILACSSLILEGALD